MPQFVRAVTNVTYSPDPASTTDRFDVRRPSAHRSWLARVGFVGFLGFAVATSSSAQSLSPANERRVALVIGNSAYTNSPLRNPVNDARAMARTLKGLGFDVIAR